MEAQEAKGREAAITPNLSRAAFDRGIEHSAGQESDSTSSSGEPVVDRMAASAHGAVDKVASVASHAVETLGTKGEQLNVAEKRMVAGTRQYVQEHPVTSLGIAIAAGYILSRMFASR